MNLIALAEMLEEAAKALRDCHARLDHLQGPTTHPVLKAKFSVRTRKALVRAGVETVEQLTEKTPDDLLELRNFGVTCLSEVRDKMAALGLRLLRDDDPR